MSAGFERWWSGPDVGHGSIWHLRHNGLAFLCTMRWLNQEKRHGMDAGKLAEVETAGSYLIIHGLVFQSDSLWFARGDAASLAVCSGVTGEAGDAA